MSDVEIRPLVAADRAWVAQFIVEQWGDAMVVAHGRVYYPAELPGFAAFADGRCVGLLSYQLAGDACEIVTLDSLLEGRGIGSRLIAAVLAAPRAAGCARLWLITTNDNMRALHFYQKRGFALVAVHRGAVDRARALKPAIPTLGFGGIPLRDEIELERWL